MSTRNDIETEFQDVQQEPATPRRPVHRLRLETEDIQPEDFYALEVKARADFQAIQDKRKASADVDGRSSKPRRGRSPESMERNREYFRKRSAKRRPQEAARHRAYRAAKKAAA